MLMENVIEPLTLTCYCKARKEHRLTLDGSKTGNYFVELCRKCYEVFDKRFMLSEEVIG